MRLVKNLCRIIVGIVFIYSGFVKGIDPLGSDYKFTDYFNAFGMGWMNTTTLFFSFALSLAEFLIGIALLFNLWVSRMAWGSLLFMAFFTPLTLVLALTNPVSDCGCFGDAMILTNWQTFWKNIILLLLAIMIFVYRKEYKFVSHPGRSRNAMSFHLLLSSLTRTGFPSLRCRQEHHGRHETSRRSRTGSIRSHTKV